MSDSGTIAILSSGSAMVCGQDFLEAHIRLGRHPGFMSLDKSNGVYPIHQVENAQIVVGQHPDDEEESRALNSLARRGKKTAVFVHCQWEYYSASEQDNVARALDGAAIGITPARFLTERMQERFSKVRWKTVDGCVDTRKFHPTDHSERSAFRSRYELAEGDKTALFAGRLEPAKGTKILEHLCENPRREFAVLVQYPAWGEMPQTETFQAYEDLCAKLSASPKVRCLADRNPRFDPRPICFADIFVSTSLSEVQPLVLLEALACGVPFVGTDSTPDYGEFKRRFGDSKTLSSAIETTDLPKNMLRGAIPRLPGLPASRDWSDPESRAIADKLVRAINAKAIPGDAERARLAAEFLARGFTITDRIQRFRQALEDTRLEEAEAEDAGREHALL